MVRETRHLWVGNLPDNIREDRIREHFKRYGRVQNVKVLGRTENPTAGASVGTGSGICATVAFMDIKSASKAHNTEHVVEERTLTTEYYEPAAIPTAAGAPSAGSSPAGSGYSGSSSSVNSAPAPAPATGSRYHLSGGEEGSTANVCAIAASAAAPAAWRGTNDSATDFCRRGNTPSGYGRYQRNNSTTPYSTPPSNAERSSGGAGHARWYSGGTESAPSTPGGGGTERCRRSGSGSSRSPSSSPAPSDTSRASTPLAASRTPTRKPTPDNHHQWASTASGRPLAICVRNLPTRSTDSSLKDGLYHEYKKHGKVVWVKVVGQNADRYAVVRFKKPSDVEKALEVSQDKLFFGCKISVAPHQSCDEDADSVKPYETDIDEYHPKATRTLFIGNLEKDVTQQQLRDKFKQFGRIIEIDIKKGSGGGAGYAFCQFASICSVVEAIRAMDGEHVGGARVKLGFGKPVATTCVWVDGLTDHTEKQVLGCVGRSGAAVSVCVDRAAGAALVHFEQAAAAGACVRDLRRVAALAAHHQPRLCVDYASRECQDAFYEQLEKHGGSAALSGSERLAADAAPARYSTPRHDTPRSRASSYGRGSCRTPRYSTVEHYDPTDYAADRRYRVYDEVGSSPPVEEQALPYEERLQSVVVSPHRARRHRRDSSNDDRKHSKERHRSGASAVSARRSRSGSHGSRHARRRHRRRRSGSPRGATPLRDEPHEPRRPPRDRPALPMCLPLPKFAAQLLRAAPAAPRPEPAAAPASPPRPPSASSSDASDAPHSPSLEERIRSLDEKYERWSGSRAQPEPPAPPRPRHRLLEVDIHEVKPSEVVRSLLAKRSVFDEDSERLEGAGRGEPPRSLRYPFPAHPTDPRLHRAPQLPPDRLAKINEADYRRVPPPAASDAGDALHEPDPKTPGAADAPPAAKRPATPRTPPPPPPPTPPPTTDFCDNGVFKCEKVGNDDTPDSDLKAKPDSAILEELRQEIANESKLSEASDASKHDTSLESCIAEDIKNDLSKLEKSQHNVVEVSMMSVKNISDLTHDLIKTNDKNGKERYSQNMILEALQSTKLEKENIQLRKPGDNDDFISSTVFSSDKKPLNDKIMDERGKFERDRIKQSKDRYEKDLNRSKTLKHDNLGEKYEKEIKKESTSNTDKSLREMADKIKLQKDFDIVIKDEYQKRDRDTEKPNIRHDEEKLRHSVEKLKQSDEKIKNYTEKFVQIEKSKHDERPKHSDQKFKQSDEKLKQWDEKSKDSDEKSKHSDEKSKNSDEKSKHSDEKSKHCDEKPCQKDDKTKFGDEKQKQVDEKLKHIDEKQKHFDDKQKQCEEKQKHRDEKQKHSDEKQKHIDEKHKHCEEKHKHSEEKSRHYEEKSARHEHHRRDKLDKEKRKDSTESEHRDHHSSSKSKKEDKHKYERHKNHESKRDIKKDSETSKSRKSSRDESTRPIPDLYRKDSTDSSASRTSHESTKIKESENVDVKEEVKPDIKPKIKLFDDLFNKIDQVKETSTKLMYTKNYIKIKEEKDIKSDTLKHRSSTALENNIKCKGEITEKPRHYSVDSPSVDSKRKERLNSSSSLPPSIGIKRRMSSQDSFDLLKEETKRSKTDLKSTERRDSKDSRSGDRHKTPKFSKCHFAKLIESKTKDDKKNLVKTPDDTSIETKDLERSNDAKEQKCSDMLNTSKKMCESEARSNEDPPNEILQNDLDFLATLELTSSEENERQKALRKEMKEKKRIQQLQQIQELQMQQDAMQQAELTKNKDDRKQRSDEKRKEAAREKRMSTDRKSKDDKVECMKRKERKKLNSTDSSGSDEPKKHSIFDIVDDGPMYISMYDKVKARSCKNMQKQEEEKRQEKIKAKFSQLKQSRAKREEKKRSSWDEDSDSDNDCRKPQKSSMDNSSDDEQIVLHSKKREKSHGSSLDYDKSNEYFGIHSNEEDSRNKLSRKNSRTRIMSDSSEETCKRSNSRSPSYRNAIKKEIFSDSESSLFKGDDILLKEANNDKIKKNSLLALFGKSESDKSRSRFDDFKSNFNKSFHQDISSESESMQSGKHSGEARKKHRKKQKKHKFSFSGDETLIENIDTIVQNEDKHKHSDKIRRHSTKKERRREKRDSIDTQDGKDEKAKPKKDRSFFNSFDMTSESSSTIKKEGKMEDIFGPLSDDSDKDTRSESLIKVEYGSNNFDSIFGPSSDNTNVEETKKDREEIKHKKEKRRKEKRFFAREDDNSLDVDAVGKAIEARLFADSELETVKDTKKGEMNDEYNTNHIMNDSEIYHDQHSERLRKESREKKKKKKRSREERQNRKEHHIYYHDSVEEVSQLPLLPSTINLDDIPLPSDTISVNLSDRSDDNKSLSESPSLPLLSESLLNQNLEYDKNYSNDIRTQNHIVVEDSMDTSIMDNMIIEVDKIPLPPPIESTVRDLKLPPTRYPVPCKSKQTKTENPITSCDVDDKNNESAVHSISKTDNETDKSTDKTESPSSKSEKKVEEKPRAIISQEETEDAVAALLGESFGGKANTFANCYEEAEPIPARQVEAESVVVENENILEEDAEEMRQAVQNLNACEMEDKPDTPMSDNDLLLIDTDTEEADEPSQDAIDKVPVNIMATNQPMSAIGLPKVSQAPSISVPKLKTTIIHVSKPEANVVPKIKEADMKITLPKPDIQPITSTATPVITSWTISNNKLLEPRAINVQSSMVQNRESVGQNKQTHISANIVQIRPQNHNIQLANNLRPIITPNLASAPYQVMNPIIRPQSHMQPPTIKIPEQMLYQKPQGIVISPRMSNDPRLQSPIANQPVEMNSPRLANVTILSTSPQNINSVGLSSPTPLQQRSPGQVTVVRMQQPPLSPIQTMHLPHGARTMISPNRPNSVLVQTQGAPIHFNRLPVTPVLAPISKQISTNSMVHSAKVIPLVTSPLMHQKLLSNDGRKIEHRNVYENETPKIMLSSTMCLPHSTNTTVMAQNRLISMQNAISSMNSSLHMPNKLLINTVSQFEKRDNTIHKSDHNQTPFSSAALIHTTGINSAASIIQSCTKPVMCTLPEVNTVNRNQGQNVIHAINAPRLLTTVPVTNVIHIDANKVPPSVLSMATIRSPTVLTKFEPTKNVTTTNVTNVVMTPLLLKTSNNQGSIRLNSKTDSDSKDNSMSMMPPNNLHRDNEQRISQINDHAKTQVGSSLDKQSTTTIASSRPISPIAKCDTDFEELLKDTTNEIKITNNPEKTLEVNVGRNVTVFSQSIKRKNSVDSHNREMQEKNVKNMEQALPASSDTSGAKQFKDNHIKSDTDDGPAVKEKHKPVESSYNLITGNATITDQDKPLGLLDSDKTNELNIFSSQSQTNDYNMKSLDENDSWSAKDVNIESVIKKVDSLCNEISELPEKKDEIMENIAQATMKTPEKDTSLEAKSIETQNDNIENNPSATEKHTPNKRGGRNVRGKKNEKTQDRVQTRQISKPARGGASAKRGGRGRGKVDKKIKLIANNCNNLPGDVYDFHEDSGDEAPTSPNKGETRPRLILTIKSPLSGQTNTIPTSTLTIGQKELAKSQEKTINKDEKMEDFVSPSPNTRKSRRLQEKDVQRTSVDDVIEDVVKGAATSGKSAKEAPKRRPTRQTGAKAQQQTDKSPGPGSDTRKSPRGVKRTGDRSLSDASTDSSDEKLVKKDDAPEPKLPKLAEPVAAAPGLATPALTPPAPVAVPPVTASQPTPIMKPPKKMISEISAKLASVFEAAATGEARAGMLPVGAAEAADARVQSPALPHRVTPVLVRGGESDLAGAGAAAVRYRNAGGAGCAGGAGWSATPSLPRGAHHPLSHKQVAVVGPHQNHPGAASRAATITSVPSISPQGQIAVGEGMYPHFSQQQFQLFQQHFRATQQHEGRSTVSPYPRATEAEGAQPEPRRPRAPRPAHSPSPADGLIRYAVGLGRPPPPAHGGARGAGAGSGALACGPPGPAHASQVPREADSLQMLLTRYPVMWQGLLALKNDSAAVQMHFVGGNHGVAGDTLPTHTDGSTPPLRIAQRMRLEPAQLDQVHRKMKLANEHCILLALPCGRDHMDVLQQSNKLTCGFITYLQRKQAAGIVNVAPPGHQQAMYTVHIFPSCDFANENLSRIAPDLMHRVADIAHLLIVIATV